MKYHKKRIAVVITICLIFGSWLQSCKEKQSYPDKVELLKEKLTGLSEQGGNPLFIIHLESIKQVIQAERSISKKETQFLEEMYDAFMKDTLASPADFNSYLSRQRTLILAWVSPTDSVVSFAWLRLPKDWNIEKEYPLYLHLHGHWKVAANPINFMSYTFNVNPSTTTAFEDGYFLSPWGRGNKWYHGKSKTDIWESIAELEKITKIDPNRKYICGHSMGGYGTWHIAQESANIWAAIGIHSGALSYNNSKYVTPEYVEKLKNMPTYFVWGDQETTLKQDNIKLHKMLEEVGNPNLQVTVFKGGHDYNELDVENMYNWLRSFEK